MASSTTKMDPFVKEHTMKVSFKKEDFMSGKRYSTPNTWKSLMTGFDTPIMQDRPAKNKRKSGWFVGLTCLASIALVLVTTRAAMTHPLSLMQLQNFVMRSSSSAMEVPTSELTPNQLNAFSRAPDVQFDNYSLILKGQRIFLQYVIIPSHCVGQIS